MKKPIKVTPKKRSSRPVTGRGPHVSSRIPPSLIAEVEAWAIENDTTRSEAVRHLVELGLRAPPKTRPTSLRRAARASELAANTIDDLMPNTAGDEEKANRKRRLLKGPGEFRGIRVDRPAKGT